MNLIFAALVKTYHKEQNYENLQLAIQRAIDKCIKDNVLREFLINRRLEVVKVMQMDYTFERQLTLEREDARSEGWREGQETGREEVLHTSRLKEITIICKKLSKNKTIEQIADELETEISEVAPICEVAAKYAPDYDVEAIYRELYLKK